MKKRITTIFMALGLFTGFQLKAQNVGLDWVKQISGPGVVAGMANAVDLDENNYAIGNFRDTLKITTINGIVTFIPRTKEKTYYNLFVLKLDTAGAIIWAKHIGGKGSIEGSNVKVDESLNVYVTGRYMDTIDFDPGPKEFLLKTIFYQIGGTGDGARKGYYENSFLLKLNSKGDFEWAINLYGNTNKANGLAIESTSKYVYITGNFQDTIDVNQQKNTDFLIGAARNSVFVAKYDSTGKYIWAKQMGGNGKNNESNAISIDHQGFVYTTGSYTDSADFDPGIAKAYLRANNPYSGNIFISKLDANGNYIWAKGISENTNKTIQGNAITNDLFGNVLITGYFTGVTNFDPKHTNPNSILNGVGISCFVAKYDEIGNYLWAKPLTGSPGVEQGMGIATDDVGSVYTVGYFDFNINLNPDNDPPHVLVSPNSILNTFISKLNKDGKYVWGKQFGGKFNRSYGLSLSKQRKIYVVGYFNDTTNFNPTGNKVQLIPTPLNGDAYIAKLACLDNSNTEIVVKLCADAYELNGKNYNKSGIYKQVFWGESNCDSIVILDLSLNEAPKPIINVQDFVLSTTLPYFNYQWFLNGNIIQGATQRNYQVLENGKYTVKVTTKEDCTDTSDLYIVTNFVGIKNKSNLSGQLKIYPNPASNSIHIENKEAVQIEKIMLINLLGQVVYKETKLPNTKNIQINTSGISTGTYFLKIETQETSIVEKMQILK